jgi:hypothetical protein
MTPKSGSVPVESGSVPVESGSVPVESADEFSDDVDGEIGNKTFLFFLLYFTLSTFE